MTRDEIECPQCKKLRPSFAIEQCQYCSKTICWRCGFSDHAEEAGDHYYCSKECFKKCT